MKKINSESIAILGILLIAAALRFWHIWDLQYTYDELSAIFRAQYPSFGKLLQHGVVPDGHPALVQGLIWLFGDHVTLLKTIAACFGTATVYFVYRAGKSAFHPAAGLFAAMLMAVLYMPVMWSQQVRPYAFGMCFSAALLWIFSQLYFEKKTTSQQYLSFAFLAALCAYAHYFAALFAALLFLFLLFQKQQNKTKILWCGAIALVLFIPHLPITYAQLQQGGLGWLGSPLLTFLPLHFYELFSKSSLFLALIGIVTFTGLLVILRNRIDVPVQKILTLSALFLVPIIVGFIYSHAVAPILQHSVLLFSAPPLLLLLGMVISHVPKQIFAIQFVLVMCSAIAVLIWQNKHYTLGYQEPWSSSIATADNSVCSGKIYTDAPQDVWRYHYDKSKSTFAYYALAEESNSLLDKVRPILKDSSFALALGSGSNPGIIPVLEDYFSLQERKSFWGAEFLCFSQQPSHPIRYTMEKQYDKIPIQFSLVNVAKNISKNDVLVLRFKPNDSTATGEIQTALEDGKHLLDWRSTPIKPGTIFSNGYHYHILKLADIPGWNCNSKITLKVLQKEQPISGRFEIRISKGNPYLYGVEY